MGDRVSIQFIKGDSKSVVLFSHWGGTQFVHETREYIRKLIEKTGDKQMMPLDRREPNTVMVDYIRHITKDLKVVESDLYLGMSERDGDNSDNGHFIIDVNNPDADEEDEA